MTGVDARRIVFVGNCQAEALLLLYRRFAPDAPHQDVAYVPSHEDLTQARIAALEQADLVVEQRLDMQPPLDAARYARSAQHLRVPLLSGMFLFPYAGSPHPHNPTPWFMAAGPFDGEMGDGFLNAQIIRGIGTEEAVATYLALDIARVRHLDTLADLVLDRQRARDAACGYDLASIIEAHFRTESLFRTPHHPNLRLARALATQFFERIGVGADAIAMMHETLYETPFPKTELPVHPAVARHFGLEWADAETRYLIRNEGRQNFASYARSYMDGAWNAPLEEGIADMGRDMPRATILLEQGLARSPGAAEGWYNYAEVLRIAGRAAEAEIANRRGVALEPENTRYAFGLGRSLLVLGQLDEAGELAARLLACEPANGELLGFAAQIAMLRGDYAAALARMACAIVRESRNADFHNIFGDLLLRAGRMDDAVTSLNRAVQLAPGSAWFRYILSRGLAFAGRLTEAIGAGREAVTRAPDHSEIRAHLDELLARTEAESPADSANSPDPAACAS